MMHGKQHLSGKTKLAIIMDPTRSKNKGQLSRAYQQVLKDRRMNSAMLKWSMNYRKEMTERATSGYGVMLYLL